MNNEEFNKDDEKEKKEEQQEQQTNDNESTEELDKENEQKKDKKRKKKAYIFLGNDDDDFDDFENWINEQNKKRKKRGFFSNSWVILSFIILISYLIFNYNTAERYNKITYTQFVEKIKDKQITKVAEKDGFLYGTSKTKDKNIKYRTKSITNRVGNDIELMQLLEKNNTQLESLEGSNKSVILSIVLNFLPLAIFIGFFIYLNTRMNRGGGEGGLFNIGSTISKLSEVPKVRFKDVAGVDSAKEELKEVVEFLSSPQKFIDAGARIPHGILLEGPPGTGKTLLAKAVAGESGSAFYTMSGSEFVEMYVGVGASRVRKLFKEAKKNKPAIIFIDEIDAVGRSRGSDRGGNDEREQTLNQLLVEMDGFSNNENVIIMAATNRADVLDKALTRAGRFDRKVSISLPDLQSRIAILQVHAKNKKFADGVKLEDIAKITPGYSGADLENVLNEASILAAREKRKVLTMEDLDEAVDKLGMGLGQKNKKISEYDLKLTAYHEGGHALVATLLPNADKVHKLTIIPRGDAGGYMMPLPKDEMYMSKKKILEEIMVCFGGRAAEELMMDDISTGASSDIQAATRRADAYVRYYGMSEELGPIHLVDTQESLKNVISEETNREIELEIRKLLKDLYQKTLKLLSENKDNLEKIAQYVLEKETITGSEVRALVSGKSIEELKEMTKDEIEEYY